jgi:hypothetical protein
MRVTSRLGVLAAVFLLPGTLSAQSPGRVPRVLELPAGTRAMALGDAYMMNAGYSDVVFYHPGLIQGASGFGLDVQTWRGGATSATVSAATSWFGGSVAIGLQTLQYGAPATAVQVLPGGQDMLFQLGPAPTSERVASVGYGRRLFGLRMGVVGKLVEERISGERDATGAVDLGAATSVGPLTVGLSAQNLGPRMGFESGTVRLPRRVTLGVGAYGQPVGPFDLGLSGALTRRDDGELVAGAGLELGYWPVVGRTFVARVGAHRVPEGGGSPFTFGFAYWGDDLVLEWAYERFGDLGEATHRFGVRWQP